MVQLWRLANVALLSAWASARPMSCPDGLCLMTRANIEPNQVAQELGPLLSDKASIFGPDDARWANASESWDTYGAPTFTVIIQAGQESDISTIVRPLCALMLASQQIF